MKRPVFLPQKQTEPKCVRCEHHFKGCCFDPKKIIEGYVAVPCFGCKSLED